MRRSLVNLIFISAVLLVATACFCSSDRSASSDFPDEFIKRDTDGNFSPPEGTSTSGKKKDEGDFKVEHLEIETPNYQEIDRQVKADLLLEIAAEKLNRSLSLPNDIVLRTKDCKEVNAFYDAGDRSVTMCYELMEHFYRAFKSTGLSDDKSYAKMADAVRFVFLHEIAHALIDQYRLPIAGNEEDAADRCSAYINLKELGPDGVHAVFAAADAFEIESRHTATSKRNMADEHLLREQRFYNSLCMIYGSNPAKHSIIVSEGYLPKERAVRCEGEYQRTVDSWVSLLEPWRKN